jgi:O-antigen biosynthesis protein WbqP
MQSFVLRTLDIIFSLTGVIFSLPILLIITFIGLFDTGSPLFFQLRVGRNQKSFLLVKFRTMAIDTKSVGTHLANAASITKLGYFLRKTKLDELPQLFNVLIGHMSLVGPRPCLFNQKELIDERANRYVYEVRPGITGLAQVNNVDMSTPRKLARYDQLMISRISLKLYIQLVISTVLGKGRGDRIHITTT